MIIDKVVEKVQKRKYVKAEKKFRVAINIKIENINKFMSMTHAFLKKSMLI